MSQRLRPTATELQAEWQICVESLLGLPMHATAIVVPFSVQTIMIFVTNVLINQTGSGKNV